MNLDTSQKDVHKPEAICTPHYQTKHRSYHHQRFMEQYWDYDKVAAHQICDGNEDCPAGNDELFDCGDLSIVPAVRCTQEHIFVSYDHVGDSHTHCKQSYDDELGQHMSASCGTCQCHGFSVICRNITVLPQLSEWTKTLTVVGDNEVVTDFIGNVTIVINQLITKTKYLLMLEVIDMCMPFISRQYFSQLIYLTELNLHGNSLRNIPNGTFRGLQYLRRLILSGNPLLSLSAIPPLSLQFLDLSNTLLTGIDGVLDMDNYLTYFNLSGCRLTHINTDHFESLHSIEYLDISNNPTLGVIVNDISLFKVFTDLKVMHVVRPETCCLVPGVMCKSDLTSADITGSCQEIISHGAMNYVLWIYVILCAVTNIVSFVWTLLQSRKEVKSVHILGCHLNVADGLIAVYLMCLLVVDIVFKGDVGYVAFRWKHSILCHILSFFIMLSVQLSTMSTLLLAYDRFLIIVWHPFERRGMTVCAVLIAIAVCWCVSVILPIVSISLNQHGVLNNACILVGKSLTLPYSVTYFVFNCAIFLMILGMYISVVNTLHKSTCITKSQQVSLTPIVLRLGVIVLTNFICWLTMVIVGLMSLSGSPLASSLESSVSLVIFPLNSFINPMINTFSTKQFLSSLRKALSTADKKETEPHG
jgi:hypothetical protein